MLPDDAYATEKARTDAGGRRRSVTPLMSADEPLTEHAPRTGSPVAPSPVATPAEPARPRNGTAPPEAVAHAPEEAFSGPLESGLRHPFLVVVPVVLLLALAAALGLTRKAEYSAEARINVGRSDVPAFTLEGVTQGNATLAASYARAIDAAPVVVPAARSAKLAPGVVSSRLGATPVPGTTLISVTATGPNSRSASRLANVGAHSLINYVANAEKLSVSDVLTRQYRQARTSEQNARRAYQRLLRDKNAPSSARDHARVTLELTVLRIASLSDQLKVADASTVNQDALQLLVPATGADSDRTSQLEKLLLIGGVAGLIVGLALAVIVDFRRLRASRR